MEKCLFKLFAQFLIGLFFLLLSFRNSLNTLNINSLYKLFLCCLSVSMIVSFDARVLCFDEFSLSVFSLVAYAFAVIFMKLLQNQCHEVFLFFLLRVSYFSNFSCLGLWSTLS